MTPSQVFHVYSQLGFKIIPLYFKTKSPIFKNWHASYNHDFYKEFFNSCTEKYNFGMLLGEIIDIEGDCDTSNNLIDNMLHDIPHICYTSKKSKHHIFRSGLSNLTRVVIGGVEFRGYKHQSVIPPSLHEDGFAYKWITKICHVNEIPFLPTEVEKFLIQAIKKTKNKKHNNKIKPGHTMVLCNKCSSKIYINKKRLDKEVIVFQEHGKKWECHPCRDIDLRPILRSMYSSRS